MNQAYKLTVLGILFLIVFSSCTKERQAETDNCTTSTCRALLGEWNLMKHSAGLAGVESYNKDDVTWTFHGNGTVDILINVTLNNSNMPIQSNQTVNYVINGTEIEVDNGRYDLTISGTELRLSDHPEVDGPMILFERD